MIIKNIEVDFDFNNVDDIDFAEAFEQYCEELWEKAEDLSDAEIEEIGHKKLTELVRGAILEDERMVEAQKAFEASQVQGG